MELYNKLSYAISRLITLNYSTSFGNSTRLFPKTMQRHIYAIYGLVRIADEVVDTYRGKDAEQVLHDLESEVYGALNRGYSTNPVVQSFALTAREFGVKASLIRPFFKSMVMDIQPMRYTDKQYHTYIYGSAEVIGLMCLRVFIAGDEVLYTKLKKGAQSLGAAYQKVNFLRDLAADYKELGRVYFPGVTFEGFNEAAKKKIIKDIENDFSHAQTSVAELPATSRRAVQMSIAYYSTLLKKLKKTPADTIKQKRIRVNTLAKTLLFSQVSIREKFHRAS